MRNAKLALITAMLLMASSAAFATNGDNLIAIGPIARSMGGVGIAAPQDAISAIFANPAAMCFGPYCPASEVNFGASLFVPDVDAKVTVGGTTFEADSEQKVYPIPAFGLSVPITETPPFWRFGISAFGVTGLGVDYKGTDLDQPVPQFGNNPLVSGEFTELSILKIAPGIAFQPYEKLSLGAALHISYATLDLREGTTADYAFGGQIGLIYKPVDAVSIGLTYVTPQNAEHEEVADFDQDGNLDELELEAPQQVGAGVAYQLGYKWLFEGDVKWINWSNADGYEDFDWNDQWVFAVGMQYRPIDKLALRLGYNYAEHPVDENDNFDGSELVTVQGKTLPRYYFETFRVIGFPALVEHHVTAGIGYQFTPDFAVNLGYLHAFEKTITEEGTGPAGFNPVEIESTLSEDSLDLSLTWRF